jgi:hypothetical protein
MERTPRAPTTPDKVSNHTNPPTYPGIASGATSNHPTTRRAGNWNALTSQANDVPRMMAPLTTATNKMAVELIIPGNRVRQSSAQTSPDGSTNDHARTKTGDATRATIPRIVAQLNVSATRR